ncbi:MAG: hypothetical protein HQK67_09980, partial [Desulfamplus sp.]|nr:hypothetical protein [Desulfamplus sp.]
NTDNYQLANIINKERKLATIRSEILALSSEKALDLILDTPFTANLIQSFPEQDLYFLMHHIGEEDFLPVLSLASSDQWEYILDMEVWQNDRLDMAQMTRNLALLYKADPQRFLRWTIKEKTGFIEYYLFKNMEIRILEHDEDPSDFGDDFVTIDSVFYFRFPQIPETEETLNYGETETLITDMLNTLADMDMSVFQGVLLETGSVIPAEVEEEEFRLKNVRLAEKGFLPSHEAVAVYQPLKIKDLKKRPSMFFKKTFLGSELPLPPIYQSLMLQKNAITHKSSTDNSSTHKSSIHNSSIMNQKNIFARALELLDKDENIALTLQSEFAFLVNSLVSADKETVRSREAIEKIVEKACSYLSLGIEMINMEFSEKNSEKKCEQSSEKGFKKGSEQASGKGSENSSGKNSNKNSVIPTPEQGASIISQFALKDIFRTGSGASMALKERAQHWHAESQIMKYDLQLTFLGENFLGVVGGLLLDRPLFFDNYTTGVLYRPFASFKDIEQTSSSLDAITEMDKMVARLKPDSTLLSLNFLTWKALFLTLWAMKRMKIDSSSAYIPVDKFKPFFVEMLDLKERIPGARGKIDPVIRDDFFHWLCEEKIVYEACEDGDIMSVNLISSTVRELFDSVFDELEDEYGTVSPEDIDPDLVFHFILTKEA